MEDGSCSLIVFDLEDLIDLIEGDVYKLGGGKILLALIDGGWGFQ